MRHAYLAEHVLLMPVPSEQSGHAKEASPGRKGQVQADCARWQVHGTAAMPLHGGEGRRFEGNGFALHRLSTLCIFWLSFIFTPESTQLDPWRTSGIMLPFPIKWILRASAMPWFKPLGAAPLHNPFPSWNMLNIFPSRHMCTAWLYTRQVKNCPLCIILILWSQMNQISWTHLPHKVLHKKQSNSKRTNQGNPVAWRLRHFSWQSSYFCCNDYFCVLYALKKIVRRDWNGNPPKTAWLCPEAWGFASHPYSTVWERDLNIYLWHSSKHINHWALGILSFFLFRETDYIPVFQCIGSQPMGIWTKQTSFPSFFHDRKGFSVSPSSNELGTRCTWLRLFLWSQY